MGSLEEKYSHQQPALVLALLVERAVHEELTALLPAWLKAATESRQRRELLETMARVVSWAIFGTALQWSQEETTVSSEEMAEVITEGVARLAPEAFPER